MPEQFWNRVEESGTDPAIVHRIMLMDDCYNKANDALRDQDPDDSVYTAGGFADQARSFYFGLIDVDRQTHNRDGLTDADINIVIKCIRKELGNPSTIMIGQMIAECRNLVDVRNDVLARVKASKDSRGGGKQGQRY